MQLSTREKNLSTSVSAPKASFVTPLFHFRGCFRKVWQILLKILLILENSRSAENSTDFGKWGLCALRHGIQDSMEAILACHPGLSTEFLEWVEKWCELWQTSTGPIPAQFCSFGKLVLLVARNSAFESKFWRPNWPISRGIPKTEENVKKIL